MQKHKTDKYLLAVSDVNNGAETELLKANKIDVTQAAMYRTVSNDFSTTKNSTTTCSYSSAPRVWNRCLRTSPTSSGATSPLPLSEPPQPSR